MMLFRRFTLVCLVSMVFGIGFANMVLAKKAKHNLNGSIAANCSSTFHPACKRTSF